MRRISILAISLCPVVFTLGMAFGQEQAQTPAPPAASPAAGTVPRLVSFSGSIKDGLGKPVTSPVAVTFLLYAEQESGAPLWTETQTVQPNAQGTYTIFLGATNPAGLPLDLFTTGAARWLAVQPGVPGVEDISRILLVGVPYALKAADADTLGGKPLSAFVTTDSQPSLTSAGQSGATSSAPKASNSTPANVTPAALGGAGTTDYIALWTNSTTLGNSVLFQTGGNVGLGTTAPGAKLEADGAAVGIKGSTTGANAGVWGNASASSGATVGVRGTSSSTGGEGVFGNATATTGTTYGVLGNASSSTGIAVGGTELATSGVNTGVLGKVHSSAGTAGVFDNTAGGKILSGQNNGVQKFSVDGHGNVSGATLSGTGANVTQAGANGGTGVIGVGGNASDVDGGGIGGAGVVGTGGVGFGTSGPGVLAQGGASSFDCCAGDGVDAFGGAYEGIGVVATGGDGEEYAAGWPGIMATGGYGGGDADGPGVVAHGGNGNPGYNNGGDGIDAFAGTQAGVSSGLAGSFTGEVSITGNLTVSGTKHFKIDHPLDPANKYLYHASIESSEVLNLYSGNIILDGNGEASVQLPEWFESLNKDFRYQLTAIGGAAPNLHIASKIQSHQFRVAGGEPGLEVSWQVSGLRQDAWEKAHPMVVETLKPPRERGYYLNPELYGAPAERGIPWARNPKLMQRMKQAHQEQAKRARTRPPGAARQ